MTDESYGLTIRDYLGGRGSDGFFFGASLSLMLGFTTATLIGALLSSRLPAPERLGLDVVFPLSFLALLLPILRTRLDLTVAIIAGSLALLMSRCFSGGVVVLVSTIVGAALGTLAERRSAPR